MGKKVMLSPWDAMTIGFTTDAVSDRGRQIYMRKNGGPQPDQAEVARNQRKDLSKFIMSLANRGLNIDALLMAVDEGLNKWKIPGER